jgi:hypothetical protein
VLGRSEEQGALKLYSFANFDWIQNPNAHNVPTDRMRRGAEVVLNHLTEVQPRVIITMESKAHQLLSEVLGRQYTIRRQQFRAVEIFIGDTRRGRRYHRQLDAYEISGNGPLAGRFILRCPQHPARIFNRDYANRIARALHRVLIGLASNEGAIAIEER